MFAGRGGATSGVADRGVPFNGNGRARVAVVLHSLSPPGVALEAAHRGT